MRPDDDLPRSARDRMLAGEPYDPLDADLVERRVRARDLCKALNESAESDVDARRAVLSALFGAGGASVWMQPPFFCDYGENIHLGERVFFNFNCIILDVCPVRIGSFTLFGPSVQILTPMHPWNAEARRKKEFGIPVEIGSDVWVGGGVIILPGVRIGARAVVRIGIDIFVARAGVVAPKIHKAQQPELIEPPIGKRPSFR